MGTGESGMLANLAAEGRFLQLNRGDWALLIVGLAVVLLVPFLSA